MASSGVIRRPFGWLAVAWRSTTSLSGLGLDPVGFEDDVDPHAGVTYRAVVDADLVGQLAVGFTELVYHTEWQGDDEFLQPPCERSHPEDPAAVRSWRQAGGPRFADGYAALRGYAGKGDSPLGGDVRTTVDDAAGVHVTLGSGGFRGDDHDASDHGEPFPVEEVATPAGGSGEVP